MNKDKFWDLKGKEFYGKVVKAYSGKLYGWYDVEIPQLFGKGRTIRVRDESNKRLINEKSGFYFPIIPGQDVIIKFSNNDINSAYIDRIANTVSHKKSSYLYSHYKYFVVYTPKLMKIYVDDDIEEIRIEHKENYNFISLSNSGAKIHSNARSEYKSRNIIQIHSLEEVEIKFGAPNTGNQTFYENLAIDFVNNIDLSSTPYAKTIYLELEKVSEDSDTESFEESDEEKEIYLNLSELEKFIENEFLKSDTPAPVYKILTEKLGRVSNKVIHYSIKNPDTKILNKFLELIEIVKTFCKFDNCLKDLENKISEEYNLTRRKIENFCVCNGSVILPIYEYWKSVFTKEVSYDNNTYLRMCKDLDKILEVIRNNCCTGVKICNNFINYSIELKQIFSSIFNKLNINSGDCYNKFILFGNIIEKFKQNIFDGISICPNSGDTENEDCIDENLINYNEINSITKMDELKYIVNSFYRYVKELFRSGSSDLRRCVAKFMKLMDSILKKMSELEPGANIIKKIKLFELITKLRKINVMIEKIIYSDTNSSFNKCPEKVDSILDLDEIMIQLNSIKEKISKQFYVEQISSNWDNIINKINSIPPSDSRFENLCLDIMKKSSAYGELCNYLNGKVNSLFEIYSCCKNSIDVSELYNEIISLKKFFGIFSDKYFLKYIILKVNGKLTYLHKKIYAVKRTLEKLHTDKNGKQVQLNNLMRSLNGLIETCLSEYNNFESDNVKNYITKILAAGIYFVYRTKGVVSEYDNIFNSFEEIENIVSNEFPDLKKLMNIDMQILDNILNDSLKFWDGFAENSAKEFQTCYEKIKKELNTIPDFIMVVKNISDIIREFIKVKCELSKFGDKLKLYPREEFIAPPIEEIINNELCSKMFKRINSLMNKLKSKLEKINDKKSIEFVNNLLEDVNRIVDSICNLRIKSRTDIKSIVSYFEIKINQLLEIIQKVVDYFKYEKLYSFVSYEVKNEISILETIKCPVVKVFNTIQTSNISIADYSSNILNVINSLKIDLVNPEYSESLRGTYCGSLIAQLDKAINLFIGMLRIYSLIPLLVQSATIDFRNFISDKNFIKDLVRNLENYSKVVSCSI